MSDWLHEIAVSEKAALVRRTLTPFEFQTVQAAIERLSLITVRPVADVADRLLCGMAQMESGEGTDLFLTFIADLISENER